jgi:hypothetical protein
MHPDGLVGEEPEVSGALWLFGENELDVLRRELRVKGQVVELESRPLETVIAFRRRDDVTACRHFETVAPIFTRQDAEADRKHTIQVLSAALDKRAPKNK